MKNRFRILAAVCTGVLLSATLSGCARPSSIPVITPPPIVYTPEDITPFGDVLSNTMENSILENPEEIRTLYHWIGGQQAFWNLDLKQVEKVEVYVMSDSDITERFLVKGVRGGSSLELSPGQKETLGVPEGGMKSLTNFTIKEIEVKKEAEADEKTAETENASDDKKASKAKTETVKEKIQTLKFNGSGPAIPAEAIHIDYTSPESSTSYIANYSIFAHNTEKDRYEPIGNVFFVFVQNNQLPAAAK